MVHILGLSGSLRRQSFNTGLLRAAVPLVPEGSSLSVLTPEGIPLYNADVEAAEGLPPAVVALKDAVVAADGVLLATPEYNNGLPGVFKNMIDWASRPADDIGRVFGGKPVAVIGASPGGFGTILAQDAWLGVLRTLGTRPWFEGRLLASRAGSLFDHDGQLTDEPTRERLRAFLAGFLSFVEGARAT
ncbi:NADPH-dependent FMN reductase [Chelatococcus reniformis]|uniref:FMN reductase n=1 Tax=Chelatococcus reniformis TaxID=1494448 RepID=A0A916U0P6_9HYPH|nr:NADPH-dependent FMN reductase [Chelatococcus reniformis]GGC55112.1 FMN reductase [Chelatococcus reniformis]